MTRRRAIEADRHNPELRAQISESLKAEQVFLLAAQAHIEAASRAIAEARNAMPDNKALGHPQIVGRVERSLFLAKRDVKTALHRDESMEPDSTYVGNIAALINAPAEPDEED